MIVPTRKDWLFSIKTFIASMLALYIALYFELPRPYWAMATVYIASSPFVGATRSKGIYRVGGTLLGAGAAIFFVPLFVDMPLVLSFVVATWTGCLLALALTDRTARNYTFMLGGYTLPLIAFSVVDRPDLVFDVAVSRSEEIILGIICASVVNGVLWPDKLGPALAQRTVSWFNDAVHYVRATLSGEIAGTNLSGARQRIAASVNGLELLLSQLAYDDAHPDVLRRAQSLRGRMGLLLPIASALSDPLAALRSHGALPADLEALLNDISRWIGGEPPRGETGSDVGGTSSSASAGAADGGASGDANVESNDAIPTAIPAATAVTPTPGDTTTDATPTPNDTSGSGERAVLAWTREADRLRSRLDAMEPAFVAVPGGTAAAAAADREARQSSTPPDDNAAEAAVRRIGREPLEDRGWDRALMSSLLWRLRLMVDLWQDCRALREMIDHGASRPWVPQLRHWRLGGVARHRDWTMMAISVLPVIGTTFVAAVIWIMTGWGDGGGAVTLAAVSCSFFASLDSPAPMVLSFMTFAVVAMLLSGLFLFVAIPNVHDFAMLVLIFAGPFICIGTLIPYPRFTLGTMLTAVLTATFLSIQGAYDADFLTFVNSNSAVVAGLIFAYLCIRITRPFGAELAAARLTRAGWADIVVAASAHAVNRQTNMAARMLDRMLQLMPRLSASDDQNHPSIVTFRELRIGLNALDLQQIRRTLTEPQRLPIDRVLAGVRQHYQQCIDRRERLSPPPELADRIDAALAADADQRGALHALVGLRLSLYPAQAALAADSGAAA